jgi:hypothetical protein
MLTRETHARIYQGEINQNEYRKLESMAREKRISLRELFIELIRKYLKNWDARYSLDIEGVALNDGRTRFYLWVPYEKYSELVRLMRRNGAYVQELLSKAVSQQNQKVRKT